MGVAGAPFSSFPNKGPKYGCTYFSEITFAEVGFPEMELTLPDFEIGAMDSQKQDFDF